MQEEDVNQRRMLMAAALCLGAMLVYQTLFAPPLPPKPAASGTATATATADASAIAAVEETRTSTTDSFEGSATQSVPPEFFEFTGSAPLDGERMVDFRAQLTNVGGAFERFELPGYKERDSDNQPTDEPIALVNPMSEASPREREFGQMAAISFVGDSTFDLPRGAVFEVASETEDSVVYRYQTRDGVVVERSYRFHPDGLTVDMEVKVDNRSSARQVHQLQLSTALESNDAMRRGGGFMSGFVPPPDHLEAVCYAAGSMERENVNSLKDGQAETFSGEVEWFGVDRQYFLASVVLRDEDRSEASCVLERKGERARSSVVLSPVALQPGEVRTHAFTAYLGVKISDKLEAVSPDLGRAINYTVLGLNLAPLCAVLLWILQFIHGLTGSWGLAIIGLTVLVKGLLFPINQKQGRSMRAMSALKPEMEKIKAKYADDKQRQSEEMMRLYREHNVNPAGGCLPMLLQMPIWFALYRSLWVSVDLYQEGFLWIDDLTTADPYWILPVTLVVVMFIQQKMMPTAMDPAQQKIMTYMLPLMFGFMMAALPAGLCFYILVNTLLTIVQQKLINREVGPPSGGTKPAVQGAKS